MADKFFTPQIAGEYLALESWDMQRTRREWKVSEYADTMRNGLWGVSDSAVVTAVLNNKRYLLNGQHRLAALIEAGVSLLFPVQVYRVCCDEEIGILYGRIDRPLARSVADTLRATTMSRDLELSMNGIEAAVSALDLVIRGFQRKQPRISETSPVTNNVEIRLRALTDWAEQVRTYRGIIGGSKSVWRMFKSEVQAVALVTLRWQRDRAEPFWDAVARNDGLRAETGAHLLRRTLFEDGAYTRDAQHVRAKAVAVCWNAYIQNRQIKTVRIYQEARNNPIRIEGTPYNGDAFLVQHYEREGWSASKRGNLK